MQGSLLDLHDSPTVTPVPVGGRTTLSRGAWLDLFPGWLGGADALFDHLASVVPWRDERRQMYDREVGVPRRLAFYGEGATLPHPVLDEARQLLDERYGEETGGPFVTAGLCLYRDGRDSVAWHGDTIGRGSTHDTMVAIISVGAPRQLALRPRGGGPGMRCSLGHGDLVVMGGSCQRTWEHAVRKTSRPVGPRISIQLRQHGVR